MIQAEELFENCSKIALDDNNLAKFLNGVKLRIEEKESKIYNIYDKQGNFIGTGESKEGYLKRDVII